jgi:hypothetical protein
VVPVHECQMSQACDLRLKDWVSLSSGVNTYEFVVEGEGAFQLLSVPQASAPAGYKNELLSVRNWVWKGNVVVAHESGLVSAEGVEWVLKNMDNLRYMLEYQVGL